MYSSKILDRLLKAVSAKGIKIQGHRIGRLEEYKE